MTAAVGFIGLGQIGRDVAGHMVDAGYSLVVWNRTREKAEAFAAERDVRVALADTPAALAARVDRLILFLLDDAAVTSVMEGPEGVLAGLRPGTVVLNFTTVHPDTTRRMAARAAERAAGYLDTPFSGRDDEPARGALTLMIGGAPEDVEKARDLLDCCGDPVYHLGPVGAGSLAKVLNNGLVGIYLAATAEALLAARAAGMDLPTFLEVLRGSSGYNVFLRDLDLLMNPPRGPVAPSHSLRRWRVYTELATDVAARHDTALSVAAAADLLYQQLIEAGHGEEHYMAVPAMLHEWSQPTR
jgi:3-hydroxyisobutyrate dehydrogenase-like beta-hydroxyacid dehydrogenase